MNRNSVIVILLFCVLINTKTVAQQIYLSGFESIKGFQIAPNGSVYVLDSGSNSISRYTESGELEFSVGSVGVSASQFDTPNSLELGAGLKLLVADPGNRKVVQFDRNLQYLGELNGKSFTDLESWKPSYAISLSTAELWVFNQSDESLIRFDENGQFRMKSYTPDGIQIGDLSSMMKSNSSIWLLNKEKSILFEFSSLGKYKKFINLPANTSAITFNQNHFWVVNDTSLSVYTADSFAIVSSRTFEKNEKNESLRSIFIQKNRLFFIYKTFITRWAL